MIEACTGLVPIFGFELKDDSEGPKTSHSKDQGGASGLHADLPSVGTVTGRPGIPTGRPCTAG